MSLYDVLFTWKCTGTHHKLALDALRHLRGADAEAWRTLFLTNIETYLAGAKAPDAEFKDFRNHVLFVGDKDWGGASQAVEAWYGKTVTALRAKDWSEAVYCAGVLGHYVADPCMPLHTGQSEEAGVVHRLLEWSVSQTYDELQRNLEQELEGYPAIEVAEGDRWLAQMIRRAAERAHQDYETLIDHFSPDKAIKDAHSGLDQELKDCLARLLGRTVMTMARILERAIADAVVPPPRIGTRLMEILTTLTIPLFWISKKRAERREREVVEAIYREFQQTGKVVDALPADEQTIRRLHAREVLQVSLTALDAQKVRPIGSRHGSGAAPRRRGTKAQTAPAVESAPAKITPAAATVHAWRFHLDLDMPVADAPSIAAKTAEKLIGIGVRTVADLLEQIPEVAARHLNLDGVDADTVRGWKTQALLACRIPNLDSPAAQILAACGIAEPDQLAQMKPETLLRQVSGYIDSPAGQRLASQKPDQAEVEEWIEAARHARALAV